MSFTNVSSGANGGKHFSNGKTSSDSKVEPSEHSEPDSLNKIEELFQRSDILLFQEKDFD